MCFQLIVDGKQIFALPTNEIKEIEMIHRRVEGTAQKLGEETSQVKIKTSGF